jgi:hypothetical protein
LNSPRGVSQSPKAKGRTKEELEEEEIDMLI